MTKKRLSQTNKKVKQDMYKALLKLMEEKSLSAISVSDITTTAKVSRMAFYRNYHTIEEILIEHLEEIVEEYKTEDIITENKEEFYEKKYILHCFQFFYVHREFIDSLLSSGMGDLFLAKISEYLIQKWTDSNDKTREKALKISAYAGSIYNMYREWSKEYFRESPEEISNILYDLIR